MFFQNQLAGDVTDIIIKTFGGLKIEVGIAHIGKLFTQRSSGIGKQFIERILTVLGSEPEDFDCPNHELAHTSLSPKQRAKALGLLRMAATLQFTVFGIPSVYYGDEVGMEGFHDPFCRFPFPWHEVEGEKVNPTRTELLDFYRALGELRKSPAFHGGDFRILHHGESHIAYERVAKDQTDRVVIAVHRGEGEMIIPVHAEGKIAYFCGEVSYSDGVLTLGEDSFCILR